MTRRLLDSSTIDQLVGQELGVSRWMSVSQDLIDAFGHLTRDTQWIHLDVERAEREGTTTIAHGFLTLSLLSTLAADIWEVKGAKNLLNYGFNRIRFTSTLPSGARIRLREILRGVKRRPDGLLITRESVVEIEGNENPAVIAEWIGLVLM